MHISRSLVPAMVGIGALAVLASIPAAACSTSSGGDGGPPPKPDCGACPAPDAGDVQEPATHPDVQVTMNAYDKAGSGSNTKETFLNVTNVNASKFGMLFKLEVDGDQYAEPLFMSHVVMADGKTHDVVFVATENDSVYAFDADAAGDPLWHVSVGTAAPISNAWFGPQACAGHAPDLRQSGITATPAIDPQTGTLYVVALDVDSTHMITGATCTEEDASSSNYCKPYTCTRPTITYKLHALDITTGAEKPNSPVTVAATTSGTGAGSVSGKISFDATMSLSRASLMIDYGNVYFATSSYNDEGNYHGWIFAYDEKTLAQAAVWNDTPNGKQGGIWMSGRTLLSDGSGHVFVVTSNGTFDLNTASGDEYTDSVVRLDAMTLAPQDWFSPFWSDYDGQNFLEDFDDDLGSAGALFIPGTSLILASGKMGIAYVLDTANLGHWSATGDKTVQEVRMTWRYDRVSCANGDGLGLVNAAPVVWQGPDATHLYVWAGFDYIRDYTLTKNGSFTSKGVCFCEPPWHVTMGATPYTINIVDPPCGVPAEESPDYVQSLTGGVLAISANGSESGTGILWATSPVPGNGYTTSLPGVLQAFDATDISMPLWSSTTNPSRDGFGNWAKYVPPTVANGKVYLATQSNQLAVYGLLATP
jgi:hypothetical protein